MHQLREPPPFKPKPTESETQLRKNNNFISTNKNVQQIIVCLFIVAWNYLRFEDY